VKAPYPVTSPEGVLTTTSLAPIAEPAGVVIEIEVEELTVKLVTGVPAIVTAVVPVKLIPVMVAEVPPASVPTAGLIDVNEGDAIVLKL